MKTPAIAMAILAMVVIMLTLRTRVYAQPVTNPLNDALSPVASNTLVQTLILLSVLAIAPAILFCTTSFTRIIVVLSFIRNAIGTPQIPPNQVLIGIAVFLSLFVMAPVISKVNAEAIKPYMDGQITQQEAFDRGLKPIREFMFEQTDDNDLALFVSLSSGEKPKSKEEVSTTVLIPAFIISELKKAFIIAFLIYMPFLVIDIVVAGTLMSMGMMMLPPMIISLPFKLLLFVMVDGWSLLVKALVTSFG